ncbi:MAG: hypothetical protein ACREF9_03895, partial [Opitutaceae bacterium]
AVVALAATAGAAPSIAAEQPKEHPPKSPGSGTTPGSGVTPSSSISLDDVAKFTEDYVAKQSKNGVCRIADKAAGDKKLALKLDRVHRERLSQVGPDLYFVCADFKTADGTKTCDLDFFVQGTSKDNLKVVPGKTSVHKEDGKERYTRVENQATGVVGAETCRHGASGGWFYQEGASRTSEEKVIPERAPPAALPNDERDGSSHRPWSVAGCARDACSNLAVIDGVRSDG